jgi:hypothetical protein
MRMYRLWLVLGALVVACSALSCRGSSDSTDGGSTSGDSTAASGATTAAGGTSASGASTTGTAASGASQTSGKLLNPCDLLTQAEAATTLGEPVNPGKLTDSKNPLGQQLCFYSTVASSPRYVQVSLIQTDGLTEALRKSQYGTAKAQYDLNVAAFPDKQEVPGVGEAAFYAGIGLHARKGDAYIQITAQVQGDNRKDAEIAVAKQVLSRIK